jgi:hypothetical protein
LWNIPGIGAESARGGGGISSILIPHGVPLWQLKENFRRLELNTNIFYAAAYQHNAGVIVESDDLEILNQIFLM